MKKNKRGPKPTRIELTPCQRTELERIIRKSSSKQAHVTRAKIILLADEGLNNQEIAKRLEGHRETARKWRNRWSEEVERLRTIEEDADEKELGEYVLGILSDQFRSGTPGKFTTEQICQIVAMACEKPEDYDRPVTHWTPAELADEAIKQGIVESISVRHAGRFLKGGRSQTASDARLAEQ